MSDSSPNQLRPTAYRQSENDAEPEAPPHRVSQFQPGEVIDERYRLIRKIGEGGMGVVWVAHSLALGVDVAIKLIRTGLADADLASRMSREAQATATLGHPAIVRVYDHGMTAHGDPFLVMEFVEGETLAALMTREGKLQVAAAIQLLLPLLDGLRCAHERGIIHRDIKPENVLIARDPLGRLQPKLLDFGIAKLEHQPAVSRLTQVGDVLGSPEFMSPEQARGAQDTDARTDVWSVCVVLYEMLTGELPFKIKNYNALMQAILHEQPIPTHELGAGDRDLWRVITKGLSKVRERRWANMTELGEALAFWLYDHGVTEDACGNSVKVLWLGGTLGGLSIRPRADSWADLSAPGTDAQARAVPTLNLKLRRFRHRVRLLLTPKVLASAAGVLVIALILLAYGLSGSEEPRRPAATPGGVELTTTPSPEPEAPAANRTGPEAVPFDSLPVEASASVKKPTKAPPRVRRTWSPPAEPKLPPTRDYGL